MDETQVHRGGTLGALVLRACQRFADRPALVGPDRTLTYRQLAHRVGAMCLALNEAGLRRGDGVALLALNAADVVVANIAIMVAGLRLTALSPLGGEDDHVFCVGDAEISALIIDPRFAARAAAIRERAPGLHHLFALGEAQGAADLSAYADRPAAFPVDQARPTDIAMIAYTGGTTGRPKGVVHTHVSALAALHMAAAEWEWPTNGVVMAVTPVSHAAGILAYPTFLRGGVFHVLPAFSAQGFYDYVEQHRVGATFMAPTMIYRLLDDPPSPQQDLSSLETIFYGAAPMDPNRMRQALERFGPIFMQLYGQTEAPTCISYMRRVEHVGADLATLASAGVPQAAVDLALLNPDGTPAEADGVGEICVRGAFVMRGYWRRDAETAAALAGGWLHTGDVGRFDANGRLHIVDRIKDLIITGGFNVYPREVEDVIGAMEGVRGCAVVGAPDATWGEAVVAFVVPSAQGPATSEEIKARVKAAKGATYAPKEVMFVDTLPLTPVGKVDKKALREAVRQRR